MKLGLEEQGLRQLRDDDITRLHGALEQDPDNASFHAMLAEKYRENRQLEPAIHEWRTAINLSPDSPHSEKWKSRLRDTLDAQEGRDKFNFTVCDNCQADVPARSKVCERCGAVVRQSFIEWLQQTDTLRVAGRQTFNIFAVTIVLVLIFSSLPLEWKACLACGTIIYAGYSFLRHIGQ